MDRFFPPTGINFDRVSCRVAVLRIIIARSINRSVGSTEFLVSTHPHRLVFVFFYF